jgi:GT2 family glycosyltransferase
VDSARVVTIVLGYKSRDYVSECIASVLASRFPSRVLFVDNGSRDGSDRHIREQFAGRDVHVLQTGSNLGYAGGNNAGIREAMKWNPEFVFILNPDTVLDEGCIGRLVDVLETQPVAALASPKIYYAGGEKRIWYAGSVMDWERGLPAHIGHHQIDDGTNDKLGPTFRANGAAMMVRMSAMAQVGPMDDQYFLYYEEVDWSERFKQAGFETWFVPDAVCHHAVSSSTGGDDRPLCRYYMTRNNLLFMSRFGGVHEPAFRRYLRSDALRRIKGWVKHPSPNNVRMITATLKAFADFELKRFGRRWH